MIFFVLIMSVKKLDFNHWGSNGSYQSHNPACREEFLRTVDICHHTKPVTLCLEESPWKLDKKYSHNIGKRTSSVPLCGARSGWIASSWSCLHRFHQYNGSIYRLYRSTMQEISTFEFFPLFIWWFTSYIVWFCLREFTFESMLFSAMIWSFSDFHVWPYTWNSHKEVKKNKLRIHDWIVQNGIRCSHVIKQRLKFLWWWASLFSPITQKEIFEDRSRLKLKMSKI